MSLQHARISQRNDIECKSYNNRRDKNYCRITRSPKHLLSTCFILNDIKPQYLCAWFCSYELPDPFSCMLTTIYGIPPLPTLAHQCVTMNSPSDLLFLRVSEINRLQQLSFCVVVVVSVVVNSICVYSHRRPYEVMTVVHPLD